MLKNIDDAANTHLNEQDTQSRLSGITRAFTIDFLGKILARETAENIDLGKWNQNGSGSDFSISTRNLQYKSFSLELESRAIEIPTDTPNAYDKSIKMVNRAIFTTEDPAYTQKGITQFEVELVSNLDGVTSQDPKQTTTIRLKLDEEHNNGYSGWQIITLDKTNQLTQRSVFDSPTIDSSRGNMAQAHNTKTMVEGDQKSIVMAISDELKRNPNDITKLLHAIINNEIGTQKIDVTIPSNIQDLTNEKFNLESVEKWKKILKHYNPEQFPNPTVTILNRHFTNLLHDYVRGSKSHSNLASEYYSPHLLARQVDQVMQNLNLPENIRREFLEIDLQKPSNPELLRSWVNYFDSNPDLWHDRTFLYLELDSNPNEKSENSNNYIAARGFNKTVNYNNRKLTLSVGAISPERKQGIQTTQATVELTKSDIKRRKMPFSKVSYFSQTKDGSPNFQGLSFTTTDDSVTITVLYDKSSNELKKFYRYNFAQKTKNRDYKEVEPLYLEEYRDLDNYIKSLPAQDYKSTEEFGLQLINSQLEGKDVPITIESLNRELDHRQTILTDRLYALINRLDLNPEARRKILQILGSDLVSITLLKSQGLSHSDILLREAAKQAIKML